MTQSEIEKAASAHAKDLLDMCDSKNWVEMSGEDYKGTIKNTFLAGAEHGALRLAKYLVHESEYPCSSVEDLMQLWREARK